MYRDESKAGWRSTIRQSLDLLLPMMLAFLLMSCASFETATIPYAGAPHFPESNPVAVEILREEPSRPNQRLGEIVVDATIKPGPPVYKLEKKLRQEGGKLGADAVVIVYDGVQPLGVYVSGLWWGSGTVRTTSGRKLIGVAVKYQG
ncbi:MAG: hypothetical protein HY282_06765 [Nitrospirae bacterium]|nr:hypothetical protein [Candidatus Manganitrophaceae bacterium]